MNKFLIVLLIVTGCSKFTSLYNDLSKQINQSQRMAIKEIGHNEKKLAYRTIIKDSEKIDDALFNELKKSLNVDIKELSDFKIINGFSFGNGKNLGLVWADEFMVGFYYDFKNSKVILEPYSRDFHNYSSSAVIPKKLILFLDNLEEKEDQSQLPKFRRSGSRFYIFSNVKISDNNYLINSIAFEEN